MRWEYRVLSLEDGTYTTTLNDYARDGWELFAVAPNVHTLPQTGEGRGRLPMPGTLGRLGDVADRIGGAKDEAGPQPGDVVTTLLWVLRRAVDDAGDA